MITAIVGVCIITAAATLFIKRYVPEYAMVLSAVSSAAILIAILASASGIIEELDGIFQKSNLDNSVFKAVLKALGLCYITNFASDTCRDFGQTSLASKVELAGKISIVILTLPLINSILSVALELIG